MGLDRSMSGENLSAKLGDKRLPDPSLFTEDKSEWIQSDNCIVCKKRFDKLKLIYTHHCRLCKNSVCGDCSGKKIEDKRVCDICYTRAYDVRGQERRSQTMQSKKDLRKKYHDDKKNFRNEANELEKNIFDLRAQLGEEEENQEKAIEALKKELTKYKDIIQKKTENNEKLKENLQANKALYFDKEKEFNELDRKLKILNKEIQHKEELVSAKEGELKQLNDQKLIYETSPSFLDVTQAKRNALGSSQYYSSVASSTGGPQRTGSITK
jgi:DNA repair exonuclease SbcCD ATPase subunit